MAVARVGRRAARVTHVFGTSDTAAAHAAHGCGSDARSRQSRQDHRKRSAHGETPAAHTSRRAVLRPKSSLSVAHSGEIVHTAHIDVLVKPRVVALRTRGLIFTRNY